MLDQNEKQQSPKTILPPELRAVLTILESDDELKRKALPHVNIERQDINWNNIFANDFGSGHRACLSWAKSLWTDRAPSRVALAIRWGLAS
jgi:hypothetical protein